MWLDEIRANMKGKLEYGKLIHDMVRMARVLRELAALIYDIECDAGYEIPNLSDDARELIVNKE